MNTPTIAASVIAGLALLIVAFKAFFVVDGLKTSLGLLLVIVMSGTAAVLNGIATAQWVLLAAVFLTVVADCATSSFNRTLEKHAPKLFLVIAAFIMSFGYYALVELGAKALGAALIVGGSVLLAKSILAMRKSNGSGTVLPVGAGPYKGIPADPPQA